MLNNLLKSNNLVYILIILFLYFVLCKNTRENYSDGSNLGDCKKIDQNMCSPDCCADQWPISFNLKRDPRISDADFQKGTIIKSNNTCTIGFQGRGCVCYSKENNDMLSTRGYNNK